MRPFPAVNSSGVVDAWMVCAVRGEIGLPPSQLFASAPARLPRLTDTLLPWQPVSTGDGMLDLRPLLPAPGQNEAPVIVYAYSSYYAPRAGQASLAVQSDSALTIWVNGKALISSKGGAPLIIDKELQANVALQPGLNTLLARVEPGAAGWRFSARLHYLWPGKITTQAGAGNDSITIYPALSSTLRTLTVRSDDGRTGRPTREQISIEVFAPGLRRVSTRTVNRGTSTTFDTTRWEEGPYEVRATLLSPQPRPVIGHLLWYKGDPLPAAQRIVKQIDQLDVTTPEGMNRQLIAGVLRDELGFMPQYLSSLAQKTIIALLMEWAEYDQAAQGLPGPVRPGGFVRLAYRDGVDDSPQFARAYLPASYDATKRWPLVVNMHGMRGSNPPYSSYVSFDRRFDVLADRFNAIMLYPHGRGNTFYQGIGDADVMRTIALAQQTLNIDDQRIYLMGYSMGGAGAWHVGAHYPERFAALGPIYGGREYRVTSDEIHIRTLSPRAQYRLERLKSSFVNVESLYSTPVFVNHGTADATVPLAISRYGVTLLQRWGYNVRYWEHAGKGHIQPLGCENELLGWLLAQRLQPNPPEVRIRATDLRNAAAHWARIEQRQQPWAVMTLQARLFAPNAIRLVTSNVQSLLLTLPPALFDAAQPIFVLWNNRPVASFMPADGAIRLALPGYRQQTRQKRAGCEGPVSDVYQTPFAIVIGTQSPDPAMNEACREVAAALVARWEKNQNWTPRVFDDRNLTRAQADEYSLILIGGPGENAVAARLAPRLPVRITSTSITLGPKTIEATDAALHFIHPSPNNPDRYVVLLAANSPTAMRLCPTLPDDVDFAISDANSMPWIMGGFFNNQWQLDPNYIEWGTGWGWN